MPQMRNAVASGWGRRVQLAVIGKQIDDFELAETTLLVRNFVGIFQPMKPREVAINPEGQRKWKWWEVHSTFKLEADFVVQDAAGLQYRVREVYDWSQAGFYHYSMTEQPNTVNPS